MHAWHLAVFSGIASAVVAGSACSSFSTAEDRPAPQAADSGGDGPSPDPGAADADADALLPCPASAAYCERFGSRTTLGEVGTFEILGDASAELVGAVGTETRALSLTSVVGGGFRRRAQLQRELARTMEKSRAHLTYSLRIDNTTYAQMAGFFFTPDAPDGGIPRVLYIYVSVVPEGLLRVAAAMLPNGADLAYYNERSLGPISERTAHRVSLDVDFMGATPVVTAGLDEEPQQRIEDIPVGTAGVSSLVYGLNVEADFIAASARIELDDIVLERR